jgi:hypothetical protein
MPNPTPWSSISINLHRYRQALWSIAPRYTTTGHSVGKVCPLGNQNSTLLVWRLTGNKKNHVFQDGHRRTPSRIERAHCPIPRICHSQTFLTRIQSMASQRSPGPLEAFLLQSATGEPNVFRRVHRLAGDNSPLIQTHLRH